MKIIKITLIAVVIITFLGCSKADHAKKEITDDRKVALNIALEKFNTAFRDGDLETLDALVADTYRHTNSNARAINKEAWFSYLHKRKKELDEGRLKVLSYEMDEKDIQFYGNTAIVTARVKVTSVKLDMESANEYRVTNIWVYESGQWERAGFHDGKIL